MDFLRLRKLHATNGHKNSGKKKNRIVVVANARSGGFDNSIKNDFNTFRRVIIVVTDDNAYLLRNTAAKTYSTYVKKKKKPAFSKYNWFSR